MSSSDQAGTVHAITEAERSLSAERRRLQDRIDSLRAGGAAASAEIEADRLRQLEAREREVSKRRRALHRQLDGGPDAAA
jgi:Skp family chaperone for outer membrane proteins